jgi:hypothetical protein
MQLIIAFVVACIACGWIFAGFITTIIAQFSYFSSFPQIERLPPLEVDALSARLSRIGKETSDFLKVTLKGKTVDYTLRVAGNAIIVGVVAIVYKMIFGEN